VQGQHWQVLCHKNGESEDRILWSIRNGGLQTPLHLVVTMGALPFLERPPPRWEKSSTFLFLPIWYAKKTKMVWVQR
jgi:hypothetical protein